MSRETMTSSVDEDDVPSEEQPITERVFLFMQSPGSELAPGVSACFGPFIAKGRMPHTTEPNSDPILSQSKFAEALSGRRIPSQSQFPR